MTKPCAWCGTPVVEATGGAPPGQPAALCSGCQGELRSALSTKGLRAPEPEPVAR